jgi:hypothetical protein
MKIILRISVMFILMGSLSIVKGCAPKYRNNTDKRIKMQKKHQKKNPNDCPRIDC